MKSNLISMEYPQSRQFRNDLTKLLTHIAHQLDHRVRHGLKQLGSGTWPDAHLMGFIPVHRFRLRQERFPYAWLWWIEHDIPPYDRYHCAAYLVELYLNEDQKPVLMIRTGDENHTLSGEELNGLELNLAQAGFETPLVIFRDFGPAHD